MLNFYSGYRDNFCDNTICQINYFCILNYNENSSTIIDLICLIYSIFSTEWGLFKYDLIIPSDIKKIITILILNEIYVPCTFQPTMRHCTSKDCHNLFCCIGRLDNGGEMCTDCGKVVCYACSKDESQWKIDDIHCTGLYCIICWKDNEIFCIDDDNENK